MHVSNRDHELSAVLLNQSTFDLPDLRSHRTAERSATGVVEIQADGCSWLWNGPPGGLQRVAPHQKESQSCYAEPTQ